MDDFQPKSVKMINWHWENEERSRRDSRNVNELKTRNRTTNEMKQKNIHEFDERKTK